MDAARFAAMSDPAHNFHFSRGWDEPPPLKRERPRIGPTMQRANSEKRISITDNILATRLSQAAFRLDRRAEAELAVGRHVIAERLSHQAAELRGWVAS